MSEVWRCKLCEKKRDIACSTGIWFHHGGAGDIIKSLPNINSPINEIMQSLSNKIWDEKSEETSTANNTDKQQSDEVSK